MVEVVQANPGANRQLGSSHSKTELLMVEAVRVSPGTSHLRKRLTPGIWHRHNRPLQHSRDGASLPSNNRLLHLQWVEILVRQHGNKGRIKVRDLALAR
ncbi:MAG: hypothetical protein NVSMB33_03430 [Ktedonobacteraceae bacterium]